MEDGRRVMDQIVMQYHSFCLIAFLFIEEVNGSDPSPGRMRLTYLAGVHVDDHTLA